MSRKLILVAAASLLLGVVAVFVGIFVNLNIRKSEVAPAHPLFQFRGGQVTLCAYNASKPQEHAQAVATLESAVRDLKAKEWQRYGNGISVVGQCPSAPSFQPSSARVSQPQKPIYLGVFVIDDAQAISMHFRPDEVFRQFTTEYMSLDPQNPEGNPVFGVSSEVYIRTLDPAWLKYYLASWDTGLGLPGTLPEPTTPVQPLVCQTNATGYCVPPGSGPLPPEPPKP